jgi:uncharacterized UBP type Zn finger protein
MDKNSERKLPTGEALRKQIWGGAPPVKQCTHRNLIREVTPGSDGCEECLATGDSWIHLRLCLTCGHVGCCNDSKNKHAAKHYHTTGHPLVKPFGEADEWVWCYADEVMVS